MNSILKCIDKIWFDIYGLNKSVKLSQRFLSSRPENLFTTRTHTCGELSSKNVGENVVLCGWLQYQRMNKFAILRDAYGTVQVVVPEMRHDIMKSLGESSLESVICIHGKVINRPESQTNKNMSTGSIEIIASDYAILNNVKREMPFSIRNYNKAKESTRMRYRYLDLRFPEMQRNLRLRSKVIFDMRKNLIGKGFIEVETPTLFKRTPGGAQEYVVPTEVPGDFYALVQSPQQLKQLLMVGGIDRYFQVARCYRNEGARPDRQPEFSQLDIEMSFTNEEGVMDIVEGLVRETWPEKELGPLLPSDFPRITFNDAIQFYGTDKPDISSNIKIQRFNKDILLSDKAENPRLLIFPQSSDLLSNSFKKWIDDLRRKKFKQTKLYSWKMPESADEFKSMLAKGKIEMDHLKFMSSLDLAPGDLVFLALGKAEIEVLELLGKIRTEMLKSLSRPNKWNMLWVTEFPLFEKAEDGNLKSMHHPFTQPNPLDIHYLNSDPLKVRGLHYDLVLNGWEIAGGSVRIHSAQLQETILNMLKIDLSGLKHMIEALDSGAPPHAGVAFGLDRYISLMVDAPSIRDVIAFPKTSEGRDLMSSAPSPITDEELDLYKISVNKPMSSNEQAVEKQYEFNSSHV